MRVVLASQSPRRKQLLSYLVDEFEQRPADIDETPVAGETPQEYVARLAESKALAVLADVDEDAIVIGSDTTVVGNNTILGKPEDLEDCRRMLNMLSGSNHQVLTAFSVATKTQVVTKVISTEVVFRKLNDQDITDYWSTGEPQDKAGSYAIQGIGGKFVEKVDGSVSSVVGLPLVELEQVLKEVMSK